MASYPSATKSFSTKTDSPSSTIFAAYVNDLQDEVVAVENGLRTGMAHDVLPDATGTRDLGSVTLKFRDANLSRDLTIGGTAYVTGGGIAFPAVQVPSVQANTLDDYEEGSWTPVIGGSGGTSGQTYTTQVGRYVKIGKLVSIVGYVLLSAKGTITTSVQIQGLPFTALNIANCFQSLHIGQWGNLATTWVNVTAVISANTTAAFVQGTGVAAVSNATNLVTADIANTSSLMFSGSYIADA